MPLGYVDQALVWRDRGVELARERRHANSLMLVLWSSLMCDFSLGTDSAGPRRGRPARRLRQLSEAMERIHDQWKTEADGE
jgi:hypothetical protein